jgi:hypothetical protein
LVYRPIEYRGSLHLSKAAEWFLPIWATLVFRNPAPIAVVRKLVIVRSGVAYLKYE